MPEKTESPVELVNRLSRELSAALDEWMAGDYMAVILPASRSNGCPVMFGNIDERKNVIKHQAVRAA